MDYKVKSQTGYSILFADVNIPVDIATSRSSICRFSLSLPPKVENLADWPVADCYYWVGTVDDSFVVQALCTQL